MLRLTILALFLSAAPALAQHPAPSAADARRNAEQLMIRAMTRSFLGDSQAAIALLEQALSFAPAEPELYAALSNLHQTGGNLDQAVFYGEEAARLAPDDVRYARLPSDLRAARGNLSAAESGFEQLVLRFPHDADLRITLGDVQISSDRWNAAERTFAEVDRLWPDRPDVLIRLSTAYEHVGNDALLIPVLERLSVVATQEPGVFRRLGLAYARTGRDDEARAAFRRAIVVDPSDTEARMLLEPVSTPALVIRSRADADRLLSVAESNPREAAGWARAADAYLSVGLPVVASNVLEDARLFFPGNFELALLDGLASLEALRPESAADAFRSLLNSRASWPDATAEAWVQAEIGLGRALVWNGPRDEAIRLLRSASRTDPEAFGWLAWALAEHGDQGEARRILQDRPESVSTRLVGAYLQGDPDALLAGIERGDFKRPLAHLWLGHLLAAKGRDRDAADAYARLNERAPGRTVEN